MEKFADIYQRAAERKGGTEHLQSLLPAVLDERQLSAISDAEYLSQMSKKIFQSGFVWRVVENKWSGFETVMWGFEPHKLCLASDEQIERMAQDTRIIRNLTKVKAVRDNAYFVQQESKKHQGFGNMLNQWPSEQITQLWLYLKKHGSRLGGNTGPYFLRTVGKDTFLLSQDVVGYLIAQGLVARQPNSQRDLKLVQATFNDWQQQSGLSLAAISRVVSMSCGDNIIQ